MIYAQNWITTFDLHFRWFWWIFICVCNTFFHLKLQLKMEKASWLNLFYESENDTAIYVLWHSEHSNGRSLVCVNRWFFNVIFRANRLPHSSHLNRSGSVGSPPPYNAMCLARFFALSMSNPLFVFFSGKIMEEREIRTVRPNSNDFPSFYQMAINTYVFSNVSYGSRDAFSA